jgi:transposase
MAEAISKEIREKIIIHKQKGAKQSDIAKWLIISESTVTKVWRRFRESGSCEALPKNSGRKPMVSNETMGKIVDKIKETPDITLDELIDTFKLVISVSALCRRLIKIGLTYKKRHFMPKDSNEKM